MHAELILIDTSEAARVVKALFPMGCALAWVMEMQGNKAKISCGKKGLTCVYHASQPSNPGNTYSVQVGCPNGLEVKGVQNI